MKKLDYNESYAEIRKPIYLESAKILWDKTYELYCCNFEPIDIVNLPSSVGFAIRPYRTRGFVIRKKILNN